MRRARRRCWSISLALLLTYAVVSTVLFLRPPLHPVGPSTKPTTTISGKQRTRQQPRLRSASGADSVVFVALGPAARSASLLYALTSLREEGGWDGQVHVIVEREDDLACLSSYLRQSVTAIAVAPPPPPPPSPGGSLHSGGGDTRGVVQNAKMAKMKLLDLLPPSVERVVYVDCDVVTQRPLGPFLDAVAREWDELDRKAAAAAAAAATAAVGGPGTTRPPPKNGVVNSRLRGGRDDGDEVFAPPPQPMSGDGDTNRRPPPPPPPPSTVMIFADAGGHTVPVCRGCDRAHSGVVALTRGHSERCLKLWHDAFEGDGAGNGGTSTDQEALDAALGEGLGCEAIMMGRRHLSFMKDAFVMAGLTRTSTFGHYTGLLHPKTLGKVYRRFYEWALGMSFEEWGQGEIQGCAFE
ncbi:unnamed protein product [Ectocarpus sp. 8 AP-2014]